MATIREIRARIGAIKKIQQVTQAMKLVAAARLRRAQERAEQGRPYGKMMTDTLQTLAPALQGYHNPLLERRDTVRNIAVVVLSAERGLAGSYNSNIMREVGQFLAGMREKGVEARLAVFGKKGHAFLSRRGHNIAYSAPMPATEVSEGDVRALSSFVQNAFVSGEVDEVYLVYSRFVSAISQRPTTVKLLPIERPEGASFHAPADIIFQPDARGLLDRLLPRYVDVLIYRAMAEAIASEHGARMTSMTSATNNAIEMIADLTLTYNRARQAAITTELNEIVGGAEALQAG
jgi:F-type H+-transporting ATPase subunit gamma